MKLAEELSHGIAQLALKIPNESQAKLLAYMGLVQKWNRVYNLTAIRHKEQMVTNHLLDSLAVLPYLWPGRWLDVGCGAGLPGLILAIARPEWEFTLLDSNSKKTSFVQQAIIDLGISNANVYCARVEEWKPDKKFNGIISRAFAELADFIRTTRHLLDAGGRWVAMKGRLEQETKTLPADVKIEQIIPLQVPGLKAARHLAILKTEQA
jgi:16S rRNA (guanine527-N7)-methyltransferase